MKELRPCQEKSINAGLFDEKNLLVCTPTASGKTLVAELAFLNNLKERKGKTIYIVPLKALASEKYNEFKKRYKGIARIGLSIGNTDSAEPYLEKFDVIITTSEKFDSLIRHHTPWLTKVSTLIADEIHLLNDPGRGPTLEIIITLLRSVIKNIHILGLSATIGNPTELAKWLDAEPVIDYWRPVKLYEGVYNNSKIYYNE
ncbi:MAG: DEAD/DEAH box helicase [Nanoarchaeota archaeon]